MQTAQRLMLKYNLQQLGTPPLHGYQFRHIGPTQGRVDELQRRLGAILHEHFFVEVIWVPVWRPLIGKRGTVLEACGTQANLEMADYVYHFLSRTGEELWRAHRHEQGISKNAHRRSFILGVLTGFDEQLVASRTTHHEAGLVWQGDPELYRYLRQRHPHVRTTYRQARSPDEAHAYGRRIGRELTLSRPIGRGSGSQQTPLRLKSAR